MGGFSAGPFQVGVNTMWIGGHGLLMQLAFIGLAFLFGAILLAAQGGERLVRGLKAVSLLTVIALALLMVTGIVPDVRFEKGADFSGTIHNDFGTFQSTVSDDNLSAFTGPLLFDMMEHISFIVPGLAVVLCFLIWHYGRRVIEDRAVRRSALWVLATTVGWMLVIGHIGFYVSKVLAFPYTR